MIATCGLDVPSPRVDCLDRQAWPISHVPFRSVQILIFDFVLRTFLFPLPPHATRVGFSYSRGVLKSRALSQLKYWVAEYLGLWFLVFVPFPSQQRFPSSFGQLRKSSIHIPRSTKVAHGQVSCSLLLGACSSIYTDEPCRICMWGDRLHGLTDRICIDRDDNAP